MPLLLAAPFAAKEAKAVRKGKTLEQIEEEEGGPVKESQVRYCYHAAVLVSRAQPRQHHEWQPSSNKQEDEPGLTRRRSRCCCRRSLVRHIFYRRLCVGLSLPLMPLPMPRMPCMHCRTFHCPAGGHGANAACGQAQGCRR